MSSGCRLNVLRPATGNKAKKLATLDLVNVQFKVGPHDDPLLACDTQGAAPCATLTSLAAGPTVSLDSVSRTIPHGCAEQCTPRDAAQVFFRLNTVRLCASLERAVASKGFLPLEQFPPAHQVQRKGLTSPVRRAPLTSRACYCSVYLESVAYRYNSSLHCDARTQC